MAVVITFTNVQFNQYNLFVKYFAVRDLCGLTLELAKWKRHESNKKILIIYVKDGLKKIELGSLEAGI